MFCAATVGSTKTVRLNILNNPPKKSIIVIEEGKSLLKGICKSVVILTLAVRETYLVAKKKPILKSDGNTFLTVSLMLKVFAVNVSI